MLSDSLTKVMTMPKRHVRRRGLKDLQLGTFAMVMTSQMVEVGARAAENQTIDHHPAPEWFVLTAAVVVFMLGLMAGMLLDVQDHDHGAQDRTKEEDYCIAD